MTTKKTFEKKQHPIINASLKTITSSKQIWNLHQELTE